jgi:hypothetical protein
MTSKHRQSRIRGCILWAELGDALGAPFEFRPFEHVNATIGKPWIDGLYLSTAQPPLTAYGKTLPLPEPERMTPGITGFRWFQSAGRVKCPPGVVPGGPHKMKESNHEPPTKFLCPARRVLFSSQRMGDPTSFDAI